MPRFVVYRCVYYAIHAIKQYNTSEGHSLQNTRHRQADRQRNRAVSSTMFCALYYSALQIYQEEVARILRLAPFGCLHKFLASLRNKFALKSKCFMFVTHAEHGGDECNFSFTYTYYKCLLHGTYMSAFSAQHVM